MTAVIMCGGRGGRMKTVCRGMSKAEMSVCGRKLYTYAADAVSFADSIIISAERDIHSEYIFCEAKEDIGSSLNEALLCSAVTYPLAVLFGDILCDMDYKKAVEFAGKEKAVTVLVSSNGCGGYYADENGRISAAKTQNTTGAVCGFIISQKPENKFPSGDIDVLTKAFSEKCPVKIYGENCFMLDIDTPEDYIKAHKAVMFGRYIPARPFREGYFSPSGVCCGGAECDPPVYIGRSCVIDSGVKLGAGTAVGDCVYIGKGAELDGTVVLNGAYIGERVKLHEAVVCGNARLLSGAEICGGKVIGGMGEDSPEKSSSRNILSEQGARQPLIFDSEGRICGKYGGAVDPVSAAAAGSAAVWPGRRICIGCRGSAAANAIMRAFSAGVNAAGGEAVLIGEVSEPMLRFAVRMTGSDCGVYIGGEEGASLNFCSADGLPTDEESRQRIEEAASRGEYCHAGYKHYGTVTEYTDIIRLYENSLDKLIRADISGIFADISSPDDITYNLCRRIFRRHGAYDRSAPRISFHISGDGRRISAYSDETGYIFHERIIMICIKRLKNLGMKNIAVNSVFPSAADSICPLMRYEQYPDYREMTAEQRKKDIEARAAAASLPFTEDGAAAAVILLDHLAAEGISLAEAEESLPKYASAERFIPMRGSSDALKRILPPMNGSEKSGKVIIRPLRTGGGVMLHVESYAAETASEICDFYEGIIRRLEG